MSHHLAEVLDDLRGIESPTAPILSVYVNLYPERLERRSMAPRMHGILGPMTNLAESGELDHNASMSLRSSIDRVMSQTTSLETRLDPSVALFVCDDVDLDERLPLPRRVWDCAVAGPAPYVRPLQAILDEFRKVAAVVLDSRRAEITVFHIGKTLGHQVVEGEELRKSNLAGWHGLDEYRNRQHAEEARHHLFREVGDRLNRLRRDDGVELVLIGGQHETTQAALAFLDRDTQRISQTFVTDVHMLTPHLLAKTVAEVETEYECEQEHRQVDEIYALATAGGLAVVGVDRVLREASRNAVSELLVHDGVSIKGVICTRCSALFRSGFTCRSCGGKTDEVSDLFEAVTRAVIDTGGTVEHVMAHTPLATDLLAARLRFAA